MEHKIKRLNEELARWAFEITLKNNATDWVIAFTNPTAGPWKTIKCFDENGQYGEVYRFSLEENRPDIILVNDELRIVLIIEAKDSIGKLMESNQIEKSCQVVAELSEILRSRGGNKYWGVRSGYTVIAGLLWGSERSSRDDERKELFDSYRNSLSGLGCVNADYVVGIESLRNVDDTLKCYYYVDVNDVGLSQSAIAIERSFRVLRA